MNIIFSLYILLFPNFTENLKSKILKLLMVSRNPKRKCLLFLCEMSFEHLEIFKLENVFKNSARISWQHEDRMLKYGIFLH